MQETSNSIKQDDTGKSHSGENQLFFRDVIQGLSSSPKSLPCKYFYDETGSELFDLITTTKEYYQTRTEMDILRTNAEDIASRIGDSVDVVELGSCNETKAKVLLDALPNPRSYTPVDVSDEHLQAASLRLRQEYEGIDIQPLAADFTTLAALPGDLATRGKVTYFFAGSTIGNFEPQRAATLLAHWRNLAPGCSLLVGVDLIKDTDILNAAYNDSDGYTAAFNLNLLEHANKRLGTDFNTECFEHVAFYNQTTRCIEMHLRSLRTQTVHVGEYAFRLMRDETIRTERSYKYDKESLKSLAATAGMQTECIWTDPQQLFSVNLLRDAHLS